MNKLLSEKEAADYIGISEKELKGLVQGKRLRAYKIGGQFLRFEKQDLDAFKAETARVSNGNRRQGHSLFSRAKDYFYYNDFYIIIAILIVILLALVFKASF
jgi:excisionase family DNA binding protein